MRPGKDGLPRVGETKSYLAVRRSGSFRDIDVDEGGTVRPRTGGMSVSPPPQENLPEQLRPPRFGGYGKDPLWELHTHDLPPELRYRPDPKNPHEARVHRAIEAEALRERRDGDPRNTRIVERSCDKGYEVSMMEQRRHNEVEARLQELARMYEPGALMGMRSTIFRGSCWTAATHARRCLPTSSN
jgi:hypothetical protein